MFIHETAVVADSAQIGENTKVWNQAQVREHAAIGKNCVIGKNTYIDHHVILGNNVKVQNNVSIYFEAVIEDGVFISPHVCFTNDKVPRAINPDGSLKTSGTEGKDWDIGKIIVKKGATIGANATVLPGVTIGKWAMVAAGAIVTKDVPDHGLVLGTPAKLIGHVCACGFKLDDKNTCTKCGKLVSL